MSEVRQIDAPCNKHLALFLAPKDGKVIFSLTQKGLLTDIHIRLPAGIVFLGAHGADV